MRRVFLFLILAVFGVRVVYGANVEERTFLRVTVTMRDSEGDRLVAGLVQQDFEVLDRGTPQLIDYFSDSPSPSSVTILLDMNGSMQSINLSTALESLIEISNARLVPDEVALIAFSDRPKAVKDFAWRVENINIGKIYKLLEKQDRYGENGLVSAFTLAKERILAQASNHNRALVLITDAEEDLNLSAMRQIRSQIEAIGVRVYGIFFPGGSRLDLGRLHHLVMLTGGVYFQVSNPDHLILLVGWILHELRYQYIIGLSPDPLLPGEEGREFSVRLPNPRLMPGTAVRFTTAGSIGRVQKAGAEH